MSLIVLKLLLSIRIIPPETISIVERFGKYKKILRPGINFVVPFDNIKNITWNYTQTDFYNKNDINKKIFISWMYIPTNIIPLDFPIITCTTRDNINVFVDLMIFLLIKDPVVAVYKISNPLELMQNILTSETRRICRENDISIIMTSGISTDQICQQVNSNIKDYGIHCQTITVQEIKIPDQIIKNMENNFIKKNEVEAQFRLTQQNHELKLVELENESQRQKLRDLTEKEIIERQIERNNLIRNNEMYLLQKKNNELKNKLSLLKSLDLSESVIADIHKSDCINESLLNTKINTLYLKSIHKLK